MERVPTMKLAPAKQQTQPNQDFVQALVILQLAQVVQHHSTDNVTIQIVLIKLLPAKKMIHQKKDIALEHVKIILARMTYLSIEDFKNLPREFMVLTDT